MIAVLRSELYRTATVRASVLALIGLGIVAACAGYLSDEFWALMAGIGTFGIAVMVTCQHYQHRTAMLLFLGEPHRLRILAAQSMVAMALGVVLVAVSGIAVVASGESDRYLATLLVSPLLAVFGVANATIVRRPLWLIAGWLGWLLFVEGILYQLEGDMIFSAFLAAASGSTRGLLWVSIWTAASLPIAAWSIRRDLSGD
ncbi:ABC-2 type transport system ATP-binding protein [Actinoplanes campanulatus]|uniref:ABC-2 type transport system ATP-binding protein n=1 Tax=Actinoplanes campanulatus TaxID=113559 RepID=A0A7W5AE63_9ACTN|nr:hypothetical protein [Actinoplanes campanulatus]MBB3094385.1 ABC-2 type transport system ATP-binding protein [Actinoplanes campanulatus]GGN20692.1 hypothetical protein GCM10010109_34500 [Actinoplanes campanulatus]GID35700.1 hypothetical protein Aca09nite_22060 [Actinoplanes campanulatus]